MNTERSAGDDAQVAMPEMQLFGLPADTINVGAVATVSCLKAEDATGIGVEPIHKYTRPLEAITLHTGESFRRMV
jgi:hypothetical protein